MAQAGKASVTKVSPKKRSERPARVAIGGFSPVSYFEKGIAEKGDPNYVVSYRGENYHLTSVVQMEKFQADPAKYQPHFGGWSKTARHSWDPECFQIANGRLFLFQSKPLMVKESMQKKVVTIRADDTVDRAFFLLHYEKIRHLPVIDKNKVVGILSDRDLYKVLGPRRHRSRAVTPTGETVLEVIPRRVRRIMHKGVVTIDPQASLSEAALLMARRKIGALPVVQNDKLIGIITATDILLAFAKLGRS